MKQLSRAGRASYGCGYLPKEERTGLLQTPDGPTPTVCVGYTASLPQVLETGRALGWRRDGHLSEFYDGEPMTQLLRDAVDILGSECKRVEVHAFAPKDGKS